MTRSEACPPSREGGGQAGIECSRARLRILVSHEPPSSRKKAMLNRLLPVLVIGAGLLLAGTVSSCSSTPSQSASTSPAPSYSANDATRVTAPALFAAYKNHKAASDELYKGRLLEVTGTVDAVGTESHVPGPRGHAFQRRHDSGTGCRLHLRHQVCSPGSQAAKRRKAGRPGDLRRLCSERPSPSLSAFSGVVGKTLLPRVRKSGLSGQHARGAGAIRQRRPRGRERLLLWTTGSCGKRCLVVNWRGPNNDIRAYGSRGCPSPAPPPGAGG